MVGSRTDEEFPVQGKDRRQLTNSTNATPTKSYEHEVTIPRASRWPSQMEPKVHILGYQASGTDISN
jgi:hypothetical protein